MKILIPFNHPEKTEEFIKAGAEEFYYGFYDPEFTQRFGEFADLNRLSGYGKDSNQLDFKEFLQTTRQVKEAGGSSFLTMNPGSYSKEQLNYIEEKYIPQLLDSSLDGIIVSDINLIRLLNKYNFNLVSSTICGIYNSDIAKEFINLGINRLIVPRDLSLEEIESIKSNIPDDIKLEVFFMRNGCIFSDGYCMGMHRRGYGATCAFIRNHYKTMVTPLNLDGLEQEINLNDRIYSRFFHNKTCGLCALYRLNNMNVHSLKIVGRSDNPDFILDDIQLIKENIEIAQNSTSEEEFLDNMIKPKDFKDRCEDGLQCYYPEVRF